MEAWLLRLGLGAGPGAPGPRHEVAADRPAAAAPRRREGRGRGGGAAGRRPGAGDLAFERRPGGPAGPALLDTAGDAERFRGRRERARLQALVSRSGLASLAGRLQKLRPPFALPFLPRAAKKTRQPSADVREEVAKFTARFQDVPLYAVATPKGLGRMDEADFVVVSDAKDAARKLLMCFTSKAEAQVFCDTVKKQGLAAGFVGALSLQQILQYHLLDRPAEYRNVAFRFVPSPAQVARAQDLLRERGEQTIITGVPVFQGKGLTVKRDGQTFYPLFLDHANLDAALAAAAQVARKKPSEHLREVYLAKQAERAAAGVPAALVSGSRADAEEIVDEVAFDRLKRVKELERTVDRAGVPEPAPTVEVGCLEDVLYKMRANADPVWQQVLIVPDGTALKFS